MLQWIYRTERKDDQRKIQRRYQIHQNQNIQKPYALLILIKRL